MQSICDKFVIQYKQCRRWTKKDLWISLKCCLRVWELYFCECVLVRHNKPVMELSRSCFYLQCVMYYHIIGSMVRHNIAHDAVLDTVELIFKIKYSQTWYDWIFCRDFLHVRLRPIELPTTLGSTYCGRLHSLTKSKINVIIDIKNIY
jgi:hypothetical protein